MPLCYEKNKVHIYRWRENNHEKLKMLNPKKPEETAGEYSNRIKDLSENKAKTQEAALAAEEDLLEMEQADIAERRKLIDIARSSGYR